MGRKRSFFADIAAAPMMWSASDVAEMLGVPQWRIHNLVDGAAYGLNPSVRVGTGKGSRRYFHNMEVVRIAIALELLRCGFAAESVGHGLAQLPTIQVDSQSEHDLGFERDYLICRAGTWTAEASTPTLKHLGTGGLFALNVNAVSIDVQRRIDRHIDELQAELRGDAE